MSKKIYVGNLPYSVTDDSLESNFSEFGTVTSAKVMMDRETGRSKGFGFVEMSSDAEASAATQGMHGQPLGGRNLLVNEARPMEPRQARTNGYGSGYSRPNNDGYAGRNEGGFRSPYGTGPRQRSHTGLNQSQSGSEKYRKEN